MSADGETTTAPDIHDLELEAGGFDFRVRVYPATRPNGSMLVWLHGGAFMFGTLDMPEADQVGRRLSAAGITVVSVDYTLAPLDALNELAPPEPDLDIPPLEQIAAEAEAAGPRARFPVASLQTVAAFDWAVANATRFGADPDRVALGGASAGGNLAAGAAMRLRDRGTAAPRILTLIYASVHDGILEANAELIASLEGLPPMLVFTPDIRDAINRNYLPDPTDDEQGYAFAGGHDVAGLPPALIVTADRDSLRPSAEVFAGELAAAGVDVRVVRQRGSVHGFLNEVGGAAERTLALMAEAVTGDADSPGTASVDAPDEIELHWPPRPYRPPVGGEQPRHPEGARFFDGLTYALIPGYRPLLMDVHVPDDATAAPCVLWIHGGAFLLGDRRLPPMLWKQGMLFQKLIDAGFAVATIDYRFSLEAPFPAALHDTKAAIRYLREFAPTLGIDASHIAVWGESAGGHLAALAGLTGDDDELAGTDGVIGRSTEVAAVVDWYGPADFEEMIRLRIPPPMPAEGVWSRPPEEVLIDGSPLGERAAALASPVSHVHPDAPPFLIMHGDRDSAIPLAQSEDLAQRLSAAGVAVDFRVVEGAEHAFLGVDAEPLIDQATAWLTTRFNRSENT